MSKHVGTTLNDFVAARPELARALATGKSQSELDALAADQITSADIPVVAVTDAKTGYRVDALGPPDSYFAPMIERGERRARATLSDVYARLDFYNQAGRLAYHDDTLWIDDTPSTKVFKEWDDKHPNWKFNADGFVGPAAYLEGRSIGQVTARLAELEGDKHKLAEEAALYGLTCNIDERGNMSGTLFQTSKFGTPPSGAKLRGVPVDGKPNLAANPIVNLRDHKTGEVRKDMAKKIADIRRAKGGERLFASWVQAAKDAGYSLDGRKIK